MADGSGAGGARAAEAGSEPDYRFTLANERTFLAWVRTGLGLMAAGIAAHFLDGDDETGRDVVALVAIGAALLCVVNGYLRYVHVQRAIQAGGPLPRPHGIAVLAATLVGVAVLAAALVAVG